MEKFIFNFLDIYVSNGFIVKKSNVSPITFSGATSLINLNYLYSSNDLLLFVFDDFGINNRYFSKNGLREIVSNFFSIKPDKSQEYIIEWFFQKSKIKNIEELIKILDKNESNNILIS